MTTDILPISDEVGIRIRMARSLLHLNRREFCEKHGLNVYTIQAWEIGRNQVSATSLRRFCEALEKDGVFCTPEWLLHGKGSSPFKMGSKGITIQAEREWIEPTNKNLDEAKQIESEVKSFKKTQKEAGYSPVVIEIDDNAMQPLYAKGDYVGGRKVAIELIDRLIGQIVMVETGPGNFVVRRLLEEGPRYLLIPTDSNARAGVLNKIESACEILWHRKVSKINPCAPTPG